MPVEEKEETVADVSKRIFGDDPLLLDPGRQTEYGRAVLKNLLINRAITTSIPFAIDLHTPKSREHFLTRRPPVPDRPPSTLIDRYEEVFRKREGLEDDEKKELRKVTMLADGTLTERRTPGYYSDHDAAESELKQDHAESLLATRFRVAAIGHRVRISKLVEDGYLQEDLCGLKEMPEPFFEELGETKIRSELGRTRQFNDSERTRGWEDAITTNVGNALGRKSQIILLPELALPPVRQGDEPIEKRLRELSHAAAYDHFLQAGTRHEGRHNRGLILANKGGQVAPDWWHYKAASAKGLHENILGPYGENIPTYMTDLDNLQEEKTVAISVAVCYDAFDPTVFLNLLALACKHSKDFVRHFLLVPSFNPSRDLVALLREFSFLARCTVVYVNGLHGDAEMFVNGFSMTDFASRSDEIILGIETRINDLSMMSRNESTQFIRHKTRTHAHERSQADALTAREVKDQVLELRNLHANLINLRNKGALRHLITFEACDSCGDEDHGAGGHCAKDLLYFNVDAGLIGALDSFRSRGYFRQDRFLPEPYWPEELDKAFKWQARRAKDHQREYGFDEP